MTTAIVIFFLYGLTFPLAAFPSLLKEIFVTVPDWWYAYLIIGGIAYFSSLYGVFTWKKWAAYLFPVILAVDTLGLYFLTQAYVIRSEPGDIIIGIILVSFWLFVFLLNKEHFR